MDGVRVMSLNVRGLNIPEKRHMLFNDMKRYNVDIAFIQETHFKNDKFTYLRNRFYPIVYHSTNPISKSKGVSVLLSSKIPWKYQSSIIDQAGRYIFLKGWIWDKQVTLATIYTPNELQATFMRDTLEKLQEFREGQLILGGDFNVPLIPSVDTSTGKSSIPPSQLKRIAKTLHKAQLIDAWRLQHSGERDYSFYSPMHRVYTRIDYFLVPHTQLHAVSETSIGNRTWSDHAPIFLTYKLNDTSTPRHRFWRLNESLLQVPEVLVEVNETLKLYFQENDQSDCDPGILWEAHKPVIRGILIKHGARIKRERNEQLLGWLQKLSETEARHKHIPTQSSEAELKSIRTQITDLLWYKAKAALQFCRRVSYESGDKCGKMLAKAVRDHKLSTYVPHINRRNGQKAVLPAQVTQAFKDFYSCLYNLSGVTKNRVDLEDYITSSQMPSLSQEIRTELDSPITLMEVEHAVRHMKLGKAPGPDGLTLQYYRTLLPILGIRMLTLYNTIGAGGMFAKETLGAHISMIHKEGKDPADCGSYRPISLLNVDLKLYTTVLAARLAYHLQQLIHLDQVGFIPSREARDSTIKVLNLLHVARSTNTPCVFLNTDAEKAFDRVEWSFMFAVLRHIGLGEVMLNRIAGIYSNPTARVKVNGVLSDPFPIQNGTRQGCPLSPLLFALSLEPFLATIRMNPDIQGIRIGRIQCKISAYADDLLFSLTNPVVSLPNLLKEFERYGALSNFKINLSKSEAMGVALTSQALPNMCTNFHFKWTSSALSYLGTSIPSDLSHLYENNFPPLLVQTKLQLETWNKGLHSWFGRCNLLKMNVLPKFLYLFQALPVRIPLVYFKQVQALFTRFVWAHKKPRISHIQLTRPKQHGGLALPDVKRYYQAVHLGRVIDWWRHYESKLWTQIEQYQTEIPLRTAMWCGESLPTELKSHPLIGNTLRQSARVILKHSLTATTSPLTPILGNPSFPPGLPNTQFRQLRTSGLMTASQFVKNDRWPNISELMDTAGPYRLEFWNAVQLQHFLLTIPNPRNYTRPLNKFEEYCSSTEPLSQTLSKMYALLNTPEQPTDLPCIAKWETELDRTFSLTQKQNMIGLSFKSTICTKIQETNYKVLTRWYLTPARLHVMCPEISEHCWRCGEDRGTMLHIFWFCPKLTDFWTTVRNISQRFTDFSIPNDPAFFLLHVSTLAPRVYKKYLLRHLINAAKACIPMMWKSQNPPSVAMWLQKVENINKMEDLIMTAQDRHGIYKATWDSWNTFIHSDEGKNLLEI